MLCDDVMMAKTIFKSRSEKRCKNNLQRNDEINLPQSFIECTDRTELIEILFHISKLEFVADWNENESWNEQQSLLVDCEHFEKFE